MMLGLRNDDGSSDISQGTTGSRLKVTMPIILGISCPEKPDKCPGYPGSHQEPGLTFSLKL
jgi:hypothetical protein